MTPLNAQRRRHTGNGHTEISTRATTDTSADTGKSSTGVSISISARTTAESHAEISTLAGVSTRAVADTHAGISAHAATGITTSDDGSVRSVSLDGVTLDSGSGSVTLSGTVLCGRAA